MHEMKCVDIESLVFIITHVKSVHCHTYIYS
jgi:hypothetical protein